MKSLLKNVYYSVLLCSFPFITLANPSTVLNLNTTNQFSGYICLLIFFLAYLLVMTEEFTQLRKSKPIIFAAGLLWVAVAIIARQNHKIDGLQNAINHNLLEYTNLLLFLLVAMTYINSLTERGVFSVLRSWLLKKQFSYRQLFWLTGSIAFCLSPIADNLTTELILCAVILAVGKDSQSFVSISCINIVVAANAGGVFSPFGDITTLMVWQKNILPFFDFFKIFFPAMLNFLLPAIIMHFAIPSGKPKAIADNSKLRYGAIMNIVLFLMTIATAICFHNFLHLPATIGMMFGLGYLQLLGYFIRRHEKKTITKQNGVIHYHLFDIFRQIERIEWDTLLFFYGVILCVGALSTLGYLNLVSHYFYQQLGTNLSIMHQATPANIIIGIISAVVDNIPIMFAILTMHPTMSEGQWLLVTLTTGVGGSLLSIGSAAGIALMGQARGQYTFISHLKWSWAILLGYLAAIVLHFYFNYRLF